MPFDIGNDFGSHPPKFEPTDDQRNAVELMVGLGIPQDTIRLAVINPRTGRPIDKNTLEKYFEHELESGDAKFKHELGAFFANTVFGRDPGNGKTPIRDEASRARLLVSIGKARLGLTETNITKHVGEGENGAIVFVARGADSKL